MSATAATAIPSFLVVVEFGAALGKRDLQRLHDLARKAGARVLCVRTDQKPGLSLPDPNCAFEFSGYQDGLQAALALDGDSARLRLVFVNDTVYRSHLPAFGNALIAALLARRPAEPGGGTCAGIASPVPGSLIVAGDAAVTYVSTWAFAVCAPREALCNLRFFDEGVTQERFAAAVWPALPASYRGSVDAWLEPVHYLKGWYQAIPGRPLDHVTRQRKRFTVYLEHTLAWRTKRVGIAMVDIGDLASGAGGRAAWAVYRLADRIYGNVKKLQRRLRTSLRR